MRKFVLLTVCMLLGLSLPQIALGEEGILLFGPETFTRGKGKPITEVKTFSVLEPSIETTLNIVNGDSEGNFRVSSAKIYLNNELVVGPDRFNQTVGSISVPVVLADGENKIAVELRSKPEAFISIEIMAPNITIGPEGGTVLTSAGTKVEIPPGALSENIIISIDTLTEETLPVPVPEGWELLGAANFQPDGLTFNVPVTITIPLNIILAPGTYVALFTFDPETNTYVHTRKYGIVDESWSFVSIEVDHFSTYGFFKRDEVTIVGIVLEDGEPIAGATVTIDAIEDIGGNIIAGPFTLTTRKDGLFVVSFVSDRGPEYLEAKFKAKAITPSGAEGEAVGEFILQFPLVKFLLKLPGVPTDPAELAKFIIELCGWSPFPSFHFTPDFVCWGGGVKIEVEEKDFDTIVLKYYPDTNYSTNPTLCVEIWGWPPTDCYPIRVLIKCPKNKFLYLYCWQTTTDPGAEPGEVGVYEVNPEDFEISEVTWNNQPSLGDLIYSFASVSPVWNKIPTGSTGAITLKAQTEAFPRRWWYWRSSQYFDENFRPYFT
ncbi:MAG: hypothetical protein KAX20_02350, partial [Candidatus Omnitrophica bacterium]|nr:hypothetical protein [Candidatus Omnitrophota bacterium]